MAAATASAPTQDFYIGLTLAASSSIFIGSSFIVKKKGLLKLQLRAGQGGFGYLKESTWWAGFLLMAVGECANFMAYAFAPATLVTPLGALSVLVSAVLASKLLNEQLNLLGRIGCMICVLGSTILVIHSPKEQELKSMEELMVYMANPMFILYVMAVGITATILIFTVSPKHGNSNPLVYITVTGTIGSLSVMGCKGLGVAIKQTLEGNNQLNNWLTWIILMSVVFNITVQMNYLNKALDIFNTAIVTPILYVIFTSFVILASSILFKEWQQLGFLDILGNVCGFLTIVTGVFLLQAFKDLPVSLNNLPQVLKQDGGSGGDSLSQVETGILDLTSGDDSHTNPPPPPQQQQKRHQSPPIAMYPNDINRLSHSRTSSFSGMDESGQSPGRKKHGRSVSYNKLLSSLHASHSRSPSYGSGLMPAEQAAGPVEGITGYVKTERKHKRTSSSGSGKSYEHKRTTSSGSSKMMGHVRTSSKTYYQ